MNKHKAAAVFEANPSIFTAEMGIDGRRKEAPEKQRHLTRSVPRNQNKSFIVNQMSHGSRLSEALATKGGGVASCSQPANQ